jgi:hypothetical protein
MITAVRVLVVGWLATGVIVLSAQARQNGNMERDVAVTDANLRSLSERVNNLEDIQRESRVVERLIALEVVATRANDNRTLLYGVLGGVAIQLIVSALNLKKGQR